MKTERVKERQRVCVDSYTCVCMTSFRSSQVDYKCSDKTRFTTEKWSKYYTRKK